MMYDNGAATIQDVADRAGVSRAAVSKVIRNAYGVSPAMKERVARAIEELNYRPRVSARAMRGASFTLGIELASLGNPFFTKVIQGATAELEGTNYQLIVAPAGAGSDVRKEGFRAIEALIDHQVDGLIAVSPLVKSSWLESFATRVPILMLGRHDESKFYDTVVGDDRLGTSVLMDHLLGLGHVRIAHLTRSEAVTASGTGTPHALRLEGYVTKMEKAGLGSNVQIIRTGPSGQEAYSATLPMLQGTTPPSAIFAGNDELALGALRAVAELGLPPGQVSVAGYDDIELASHPAFSLTTMDQSGVEMGARAVQLLLERIAGRTDAVHAEIRPVLKVRRSTASPV